MGYKMEDEDISFILEFLKLPGGKEEIEKVKEYLDVKKVEMMASHGDCTATQDEYAYDEILLQISTHLSL